MNERAKQLALQALKHPDNDNDGLTVFDNDELKKFTELIVRECVKAADEWYQYHNEIQWDPGEHIKQHFGVEDPPVDNVDRILRTVRKRSK